MKKLIQKTLRSIGIFLIGFFAVGTPIGRSIGENPSDDDVGFIAMFGVAGGAAAITLGHWRKRKLKRKRRHNLSNQ